MEREENGQKYFEDIRRTTKISFFIASIIPLSILVFFSVKYIYPLLKEDQINIFSSVMIILFLTVVLSILGLTLSVKTTNRALRSIQDAYTKLNSLLEVSKHFRDTLFVDVLLETIVRSATELLDSETGSLLLVDEEGELWFKVALGETGRRKKDRSIKPGEGISGWVLQTGKSALVNDVAKDERFNPDFDMGSEFTTRSILSVPLLHEKNIIGVLEILNKRAGDYTENDEKLLFSLADQAAISIAQSRVHESQHTDMVQLTEILVNAMDHHSPERKGHAKRVAMYAVALGRGLGLEDDDLRNLHFAGILHDVGLLRYEYFEHWDEMIKEHPTIGYEMIRPISVWKDVAPIVLDHHERHDGNGYPAGKKGDEIPLAARIISVADTFDTLTSDNSYKEKVSREDALREIENHAGTQFAPEIVSALKKALQEESLPE